MNFQMWNIENMTCRKYKTYQILIRPKTTLPAKHKSHKNIINLRNNEITRAETVVYEFRNVL